VTGYHTIKKKRRRRKKKIGWWSSDKPSLESQQGRGSLQFEGKEVTGGDLNLCWRMLARKSRVVAVSGKKNKGSAVRPFVGQVEKYSRREKKGDADYSRLKEGATYQKVKFGLQFTGRLFRRRDCAGLPQHFQGESEGKNVKGRRVSIAKRRSPPHGSGGDQGR